jgi:SAM-dependent methyltransferase
VRVELTGPTAPAGTAAALAGHARVHCCPACGGPLAPRPPSLACAACGATYRVDGGIARLAGAPAAVPGFDAGYFGLLADVEDRQFWFVSRRAVILDALRRHVPDLSRRPLYDVGCGPGGLLAYLAANGVPVAGACDSFHEALVLARRRVDAPLAQVGGDGPPPLAAGQRLLGMFDVLEHIDDDEETLRWAFSVLEPGGVLVLTVPAHPFLFDDADVLAFHRRRYRRRELGDRLRRAGFEVRRLTHFMAPLVPMLLVARPLGRFLRGRRRGAAEQRKAELAVVPLLNGAMRALLAVERRALRAGRPPFGTSLLAVASRPAGEVSGTAGKSRGRAAG